MKTYLITVAVLATFLTLCACFVALLSGGEDGRAGLQALATLIGAIATVMAGVLAWFAVQRQIAGAHTIARLDRLRNWAEQVDAEIIWRREIGAAIDALDQSMPLISAHENGEPYLANTVGFYDRVTDLSAIYQSRRTATTPPDTGFREAVAHALQIAQASTRAARAARKADDMIKWISRLDRLRENFESAAESVRATLPLSEITSRGHLKAKLRIEIYDQGAD